MNKIRIIGLVLLIVGVVFQFAIENDLTNFISAAFIGAGIGLLATGRITKPAL